MRKALLAGLTAQILLSAAGSHYSDKLADVAIVKMRLISSLLSSGAGPCTDSAHCKGSSAVSLPAANHDAKTLSINGSWPDVNYTDRSRTGSWSPNIHLERVVNLAAAVRATNSTQLVQPTARALHFWLQQDPRSENWYWNELAVPSRIADTALLFQPWIINNHTLEIMFKFMLRANYSERTGANLDAEVSTQITRAAVLSDFPLMRKGFDRLWYEIKIAPPTDPHCLDPPRGTQGCITDGIQVDASFHQHGPELLAGSYGAAFVRNTLQYIELSTGTLFQPSKQQLQLFTWLLLEGMRWMSVGSPAVWDWSVIGRDMGTSMRRLEFNTTYFQALVTKPQAKLTDFGAAIDGIANASQLPRGHRAYWTSDYATIHSTTTSGIPWMASIHMHSARTVSARCVNGQGSMNEHTGDGMVYTYVGMQPVDYNHVFQTWDWRRLPGITAAVESPILPCEYSAQLFDDSRSMTTTGTVSDDVAGMSAMQLVSHGMVASKAVAMLSQGWVGLVAGARCIEPADCGQIVTTFENKIASGRVTLFCNNSTLVVPKGTLRRPYSGCSWAWHNNTGFLLPASHTYLVTHSAENSSKTILFSLAFSHDLDQPNTSWMTLPGVRLSQMVDMHLSKPESLGSVSVAANNEGVQAIWDSERLQYLAVIWKANTLHTLSLASNQALSLKSLRTNRPCIVLIRKSSSCGSISITASDPSNNSSGGVLNLQLRGITVTTINSVPSDACSTKGTDTFVTLQLPSGYLAGRSVNTTCVPQTCQ